MRAINHQITRNHHLMLAHERTDTAGDYVEIRTVLVGDASICRRLAIMLSVSVGEYGPGHLETWWKAASLHADAKGRCDVRDFVNALERLHPAIAHECGESCEPWCQTDPENQWAECGHNRSMNCDCDRADAPECSRGYASDWYSCDGRSPADVWPLCSHGADAVSWAHEYPRREDTTHRESLLAQHMPRVQALRGADDRGRHGTSGGTGEG